MTQNLLDPWNDAALIAARVAGQTSRLIIVIGAEGWCADCRTLRPLFDALANRHNDPDNVWLWLDLEDHAEFMPRFIPEDLPLVIRYHGPLLTHALTCKAADETTLLNLLSAPGQVECSQLPQLRERLMTADWAG